MNISFPFLRLFPNFFFSTKHLHAFFYYLLIEMFYLVIDIFGHYFAFIFVVEWTPFIPDLSKWKEYIHTFPGVNCCPGKVLKRNLYISSCWNCIFFQPKKKERKKRKYKKKIPWRGGCKYKGIFLSFSSHLIDRVLSKFALIHTDPPCLDSGVIVKYVWF